MNKLVSMNLSTQFDKQLASLFENEVDIDPVMHLQKNMSHESDGKHRKQQVLVPAYTRESVDGWLDFGLGLFLLQEDCKFFLRRLWVTD